MLCLVCPTFFAIAALVFWRPVVAEPLWSIGSAFQLCLTRAGYSLQARWRAAALMKQREAEALVRATFP
eukprot:2510101-Pleurochrysis_carterae.AAC.3